MHIYKSIIVICKLKSHSSGEILVLDVPFKVYGQNIILLNNDITNNLHDFSNLGKEVMAKVDYRVIDHPSGSLVDKSQELVADSFSGNLGSDWSSIKSDPNYLKHSNKKKEDYLEKIDKDGKKIKYTEEDKLDQVPFVRWDDPSIKDREFIEKSKWDEKIKDIDIEKPDIKDKKRANNGKI